ncbi:cyclase family protein [Kibdelosporangium philippinense]|uniref:Cyclase family protein n=1 Tax=Kibdelosporangium philippinense TaxID=211113 RepID=A0ABS8ZI49_9PSEU|nr:cyclase family protein [Kibdelosporangium philippinense]MCE7007493.1 cyclase family protein [Kibdelosporangium philippinense]
MSEWRVQFDANVTFSNGGALQAQEFRLDIPGADIDDAALAELFVRHLGLLMVGDVTIANKAFIQEPHKGSRGVEVSAAKRRVFDLSHVIEHGMTTHTGLPGPEISDWLSFADSHRNYGAGTEFQIGKISMVSNTGTYVDSPAHRFRDGADLSGLDIERLVDVEGITVRTGERVIDRKLLLAYQVTGKAVLINTGWDRHWSTETYTNGQHPFITKDAAEWLVEQRPAVVGIDSMNVDDTGDGTRPAHTVLLRAGIPIVEHMNNLDALPPHGFRFHAAPLAIKGMGTFSVRAYALT